jgi:hypothetical protein
MTAFKSYPYIRNSCTDEFKEVLRDSIKNNMKKLTDIEIGNTVEGLRQWIGTRPSNYGNLITPGLPTATIEDPDIEDLVDDVNAGRSVPSPLIHMIPRLVEHPRYKAPYRCGGLISDKVDYPKCYTIQEDGRYPYAKRLMTIHGWHGEKYHKYIEDGVDPETVWKQILKLYNDEMDKDERILQDIKRKKEKKEKKKAKRRKYREL